MNNIYNIEVDTHIHTINSVHAYSTVLECISAAKKRGLRGIAVTDHFGPNYLSGSLFQHYAGISNINNYKHIDDKIQIISGVEIDILDDKGTLAFDHTYFPFDEQNSVAAKLMEKCSVKIASYHELGKTYNFEENTEMLYHVVHDPRVTILGHCDRLKNFFDVDYILDEVNTMNKAVELNCYTLERGNAKETEQLKEMIRKVIKKNVPVTIGSDAHIALEIGRFEKMKNLLCAMKFPPELVVNSNIDKFLEFIKHK